MWVAQLLFPQLQIQIECLFIFPPFFVIYVNNFSVRKLFCIPKIFMYLCAAIFSDLVSKNVKCVGSSGETGGGGREHEFPF